MARVDKEKPDETERSNTTLHETRVNPARLPRDCRVRNHYKWVPESISSC